MTETKPYSDSPAPINVIAKSDALGGLRAFNYPPDHPAMALWLNPENGLFARLLNDLTQRRVHASKCVVVLPYAQLLPLATRLWAQSYPNGFSPRFETTANWSAALGAPSRNATDITFDAGIDTLTAQALLQRAGLGAQQDALAAMLCNRHTNWHRWPLLPGPMAVRHGRSKPGWLPAWDWSPACWLGKLP